MLCHTSKSMTIQRGRRRAYQSSVIRIADVMLRIEIMTKLGN
jgi:hypothetical protein